MAKLKLLVDMHAFDFDMSQGITTYLTGLYSYLPDFCPEIQFYFAARNLDKIKKIFGEKPNVEYVRLTAKGRLKRLFFEMSSVIRRLGIDYAHFQYVSPLVKNCKTIVTLHDILFLDHPQYFPASYRFSKMPTFRFSAKRADILCTVSEYSRNRISEHYGIPADKIYITPNAVSEDFFRLADSPRDSSKKYILYVSRIEPRKNHIALVRAFNRLKLAEKGYDLIMVGRETDATPKLHNELDSLDEFTRSHIRQIPQAYLPELLTLYKNASLFVYPTYAEGFGIPPLEAAASGVPVICNRATAMKEFDFFGENHIDIDDEALLDSRILDILETKPDTSAVREAIRKKYNWQSIAKDFSIRLNQLIE